MLYKHNTHSKYYGLVFFIFLGNWGLFAQKISKSAVESDTKALRTILLKNHPAPFAYISRDSLLKGLDQLSVLQTDSMSLIEWENRIRLFLTQLGCGHTYVSSNPLMKTTKDPLIFPFKIFADNGQIWVLQALDSLQQDKLPTGARILEINGVSVANILARANKHQSSDGFNSTFGARTLNQALFFNYIYRRYFSRDTALQIRWQKDNQTTQYASIKTVAATKLKPKEPETDTSIQVLYKANKGNQIFYRHPKNPEIGVYKIKSFGGKSTRLNKKVFRLLRKQGIKHLVIDVRDNLGGNYGSCVDLARYVADERFEVQLSRPLFRPWKYQPFGNHLKRVGAFMLFDVFNTSPRRIKNGRMYYKLRYKPHRRNHFEGHTYVLINGWSFSASSLSSSFMQAKSTDITFIGTETGGGARSNNGMQIPIFVLPASKIKLKIPQMNLDFRLGPDLGKGVLPDIPIRYSWEDILAGRDLEWEAVWKAYKKH